MAKVTTKIKEDAGTTWSVIDKNGDGIINGGLLRKDQITKNDLDSTTKGDTYKLNDPLLLNELGLSAKGYTTLKGIAVADLQKYFDALTVDPDDPDDVSLAARIAEINDIPPFGSQAKLGAVHAVYAEGSKKGQPVAASDSVFKASALDLSIEVTGAKDSEPVYATIKFGGVTVEENVQIGVGNGTHTYFLFAKDKAGAFCAEKLGAKNTTGNITVTLVDQKKERTGDGTTVQSAESVTLKPSAAPKKSGGTKAKAAAKPAATAAPAPKPASTGGGLNE